MTGTSKHNHEEKVEEGSVKELKDTINNLCNFSIISSSNLTERSVAFN